MGKKIFIVAGFVLLGLSAVWQFALVPRLTERIPVGWQWETDYVGYQTFVDPQTGQIPEKDTANTYNHSITIVANSRKPGSLELDDRYLTHDVASGRVTYEYNYRAPVDPRTGEHLTVEYRGDYFVFPRNVERKTYNLRFSYIKGIPLTFQREEEIQGLTTFVFAYHGRAEFTESFAGTEEFPGVKVKPGQEIKCADDQFIFKAWVEPVTGEIIKTEENCLTSDSIYDVATGKQLQALDRWGGETEGNDVNNRVDIVNRERTKLLWQRRYIPSGLFVAGLLCFGLVLLPRKATRK
jgi:hypothetical protein